MVMSGATTGAKVISYINQPTNRKAIYSKRQWILSERFIRQMLLFSGLLLIFVFSWKEQAI